MNITEEDETLCCSEAKYKDTIQDKEWLEKKINEYQKELQVKVFRLKQIFFKFLLTKFVKSAIMSVQRQ